MGACRRLLLSPCKEGGKGLEESTVCAHTHTHTHMQIPTPYWKTSICTMWADVWTNKQKQTKFNKEGGPRSSSVPQPRHSQSIQPVSVG